MLQLHYLRKLLVQSDFEGLTIFKTEFCLEAEFYTSACYGAAF